MRGMTLGALALTICLALAARPAIAVLDFGDISEEQTVDLFFWYSGGGGNGTYLTWEQYDYVAEVDPDFDHNGMWVTLDNPGIDVILFLGLWSPDPFDPNLDLTYEGSSRLYPLPIDWDPAYPYVPGANGNPDPEDDDDYDPMPSDFDGDGVPDELDSHPANPTIW